MLGNTTFVSDIDRDDSLVPVDYTDFLREAIRLADIGMWDYKLDLPSGKKMTVRKIIKRYELNRFLLEPMRVN